jgi:uncharacterized repeat protein (TIGR02543 family)
VNAQRSNWSILMATALLSLVAFVATGCSSSSTPPPPPTYTVTYDGNGSTGGSVPVDTAKYTAGSTVTVLGNTGTLVKTGFDFAGWNTLANATGTAHAPAATFAMGSANVTLYATWAATYTVTYDGNGSTGGSVPVDSAKYTTGSTVTVLGNTGTLVKAGFDFAGWNTLANATGTAHAPSATFAMGAANVTLYAAWVQSWIGIKQMGAGARSTTVCNGIAVDPGGNVYLAGGTNGGLDGNTLSGISDYILTKYDASGTKAFTRQTGATGAATAASGVAVDASGNVYVAGYTTGGLDGNTSSGGYDYFLAKYDSTGTKLYTRQVGGGSSTYAKGVAVDGSGNVYVAGYTNRGLDGNTQSGNIDYFVTKYDSTGTKVYTRQAGVSGGDTYGWGIAADASGNVYVIGFTDHGLDSNTQSGSMDYFVAKYDSTGTKVYIRQAGGSGGYAAAWSVAVDGSGNAYVSGYTNRGLDGIALSGTIDAFLAKYDATGTKVYTQLTGAAGGGVYPTGIRVDVDGNVYVSGYTTTGLGCPALIGVYDYFLAKYTAAGSKVYIQQNGVSGGQVLGNCLGLDAKGNAYVAGTTNRGLDVSTQSGNADLFVAKYDAAGVKQ